MIELDRKAFATQFSTVAACAPRNSTKDVLKNILLQSDGTTLTFIASDSEVHIRGVMETPVKSFKLLLPCSRVLQILNEVQSEKIGLDFDGARAELTAGSSLFRQSIEDPETYPPVPDSEWHGHASVAGLDLRRMLTHTMFATDQESTRYALGGVQFEFGGNHLTLAATDSRRLCVEESLCSVGHHEGSKVVVPNKALKLLVKACGDGEVHIVVNNNDISFRCGSTTVSCQLVQGRFPSWPKVVPSEDSINARVALVAKSWLSLVRQASITTSEESRGIECQFTKTELIVQSTAASIGTSKSKMPIAYDGQEMTITLDPKYLGEYLAAAGDASIECKLVASDDRMAMTLGGWQHVIMPLASKE